ncbi:MAG: phenylalanine--tRNA ligase subunit alpha [Planctomycetota bacterium]|nr:phenylalanine--tRNA ligase subunit alpha [Planctomycetota bacterium]RLT18881.1 MAG: phenylalanine--tRNA ligase subunit alpha [Planctomycetota bacterium]
MANSLDTLLSQGTEELRLAQDEASLRTWQNRWFGKTGEISQALKHIAEIPPAERREYGQKANAVKEQLQSALDAALLVLKDNALETDLANGVIDITLPGRRSAPGRLHPSTQTLRKILGIFGELGFEPFTSHEVEEDELNFGLLNMPAHHPARDMWDTFHTTRPGWILRTHTSPGQIHAMRKAAPGPLRVVLPGMCYRYEQITSRSEIMFHQVEGLAVGEKVHLTDLKGTLLAFIQRLFGDKRKIRLRSSYFPFTEPSMEVDMDCILCQGKGCGLCKKTGWLEILGAGMVHPTVLKNGGYDPETHSGFAFGLGVERIVMLLSGMDDIRQFWANDWRFLKQF